MADRRELLLAQIRGALSSARWVAMNELSHCEEAVAEARARLDRVRRSATEATTLADARYHDGLARAAARHDGNLTALAARVRQASGMAAPGAAGAPWRAWTATPVSADQAAPPVRIGVVRFRAIAVPALVPLLDAGHVELVGGAPGDVDRVVTALLTRALGSAPAGGVRLLGYDPEYLGGRLAGFAPLTGAGLLELAGPRGLAALLDDLVEHVHRISHTVLAGEFASLRERSERGHGRPEPWRIAVLLGDGTELTAHATAQLRRLVRAGAACGVHLLTSQVPLGQSDTVTTITLTARGANVSGYQSLDVIVDEAPPPTLVTDLARGLADRMIIGPPPVPLERLLPEPEKYWTETSQTGLRAPIGEDSDGRLVELGLSDHPPHALIGGPTGSGKTNLIYAWLASLATRYSPAELELYLLDFKEGVSFARFAPSARERSWLPHARLVGLNANTDREFGLALLRHLGDELRRRAEAARRFEVTKLAELREEDPGGRWPRIVAVVDEFQVLFGARGALTNQATQLLEDLARRGRSQGIHLVLASQDVSGIEALWGRSALLAQFTLRIALPKARRVLAETNVVANEIPRFHAVVNADSGVRSANQVVRIPEAGSRSLWNVLLREFTERWQPEPGRATKPRLFDGDNAPRLATAPDFVALRTVRPRNDAVAAADPPVALLGEAVDVVARSTAFPLTRTPGRNLAVLGAAAPAATAVLDAAARSLARQYRPGEARFSVALLDQDTAPWQGLRTALPPDTAWYDARSVVDLLHESVADLERSTVPHFLMLYGVDAAARELAARGDAGTGHEALRRLLHLGPEHGVHLLGWWRTVHRLRDDLGGVAARFDVFGGWVALDVHGTELSPLCPTGPPAWYPRPWRALFFDRARHRVGEVLVPYREPR